MRNMKDFPDCKLRKHVTDQPYKNEFELKMLVETYSDAEIGKMFDVSRGTIKYFRNKYKISPCKTRKHKIKNSYLLNKHFFKEIQDEYQAYILGFICADGYVHKNGKTVTIAIKQSDSQILEDIKKAMETDAKLRVKKKPDGQEDLAVLNISSRELVEDLARLGVKSNKTKEILLPIIKNDLYKHFIRGLFDGDGYIGERQFALTGGSKNILLQIQKHIMKEIKCKLTLRELKKKDGSIKGYQLYGGKNTKAALQWLYSDCRIVLERKYKCYTDYWK